MASWQAIVVRKSNEKSSTNVFYTDYNSGGSEMGALIDRHLNHKEINQESLDAFGRWLDQDLTRDQRVDYEQILEDLREHEGKVIYISYH